MHFMFHMVQKVPQIASTPTETAQPVISSTTKWAIFKDHVTLTLKSWSETRCESCVNSNKAMQYQLQNIRKALLEVNPQGA